MQLERLYLNYSDFFHYGGDYMKKLLLSLCCLFINQAVYAIYLKHIGMSDGLSQVSVMSIYQDQLGRMWFGTREGISVYDGERMKIYKDWGKENRDNRINILMGHPCDFMVGDKNGNVFFRTSETMVKYDIRNDRFQIIGEKTNTITSYNGDIWSADNNTIYKYDNEEDSLHAQIKTCLPDITCLQITKNKIWVGTLEGLYAIDKNGEINCLINDVEVYRLFVSCTNEVWVGTRTEGLYRISAGKKIAFYSETDHRPDHITSNQIREFAEDKSGNIWFGTFLGLHKYNPQTDQFSIYMQDILPGSLSHSSVFSLYIDNQETIWAGTYYGGVNYFNPEKEIFAHYVANPSRKDCLNHPFVGNMEEDSDGNIWICTEGGGLNFLDRKTKTFRHFLAGQGNTVLQNNLKNITYDKKRNKLYIGTHRGGLTRYDIKTGIFHNYLNDYKYDDSMPDDIIFHTMIYNDQLYVSARNGTYVMNLDTDEFRWVCRNAQNFTIDSKGNIWIIIGTQLIRMKLDNPDDTKIYSLPEYNIHFELKRIIETHDKQIYFIALGSGLYRYEEQSDSFSNYSQENGYLLSDYCYNIAETNQNELLITSDKGITFFNPSTGQPRFTKLGENLPITSITDGCGILICRNNELFIGGSDGLTSFRREDLDKEEKNYSLYFSELYIHNERIRPGSPDNILQKALPYSESLKLNYKQNNLILDFASTNYIDIQNNDEYEYKLEGFDKDWIPTSLTSIYYTNLNPGKYKLMVREKKIPLTSAEIRRISLDIQITPAWYNTIWARIIYIFITVLITYFVIRTKNARRELTLSLEREREEKERNEELNQAKLQFFTNISHEFRTPLTLIISQIDLLFQNTLLSPGIYNKIIKISKHANQMRNMISELLEFRKMEQNHVSLRVVGQDIVTFLKDIYFSYYELSIQKHITFQYHHEEKSILLWFDPSQLQKVFNNLLSNAFKYTNEGGNIDIHIDEEDTVVKIKVIDTGIGLSATDVSHIFDRFYQATNGKKFSDSNPGTGIGLALSKSIVILHHGEISVQSQLGYGTIFTVCLQKGKEHFVQDDTCTILEKPEEPTIKKNSLPIYDSIIENEELDKVFPGIEKDTRYTILIVEDNEELLQTLSTLFASFYNVLIARNGEEGLRMAAENKPDIIVSDVMMPVMSGMEMCMKIKNNVELCHIPVVLLTALDTIEHNIEGLRQGADDYVSKPFHAKILLMRCNNLIKNRQLIKNTFSKQIDFDMQQLALSPLDQKLMNQVIEIIEKYIDDPNFDVNIFASELGMGRSSLFTKFKGLTGMTPNEFIQNQRLKRAASMLREHPDMRISEISDQLGFVSTVYFSRCFKAQFGVSPAQFRKC